MRRFVSVLLAVILVISTFLAVSNISSATSNKRFDYKVLYDNTVEITGYSGISDTVDIPATISGLKVSSIGDYAFFANEKIKEVVIPDSVINISDCAFYDCDSLSQIDFPASLKFVGDKAFDGTKWYNSQPNGAVYIGDVLYKYKGELEIDTVFSVKDGTVSISKNAFNSNYGLADISVPDSVEHIGLNAFYGTKWEEKFPAGVIYVGKVLYDYKGKMAADTKITVKDSTVSITEKAFENYTALIGISIPDSLKFIGAEAFYCTSIACASIPDGVEFIGDGAFNSCKKMSVATFGKSLKYIGNDAFSSCSSLKKIDIGQSVLELGEGAFSYCTSLVDVDIKGNIKNLYNRTFYDCSQLVSFKMPDSVEYIGSWVFQNCKKLKDIDMSENITYVGNASFDSTAWLDSQPDGLVYINNVLYCYKGIMPKNTVLDIDNTTVCISPSAFYMCDNLKKVIIPQSVDSIGNFTFYNCSDLEEVVLPDTIKSIGTEAFMDCYNLKEIILPVSVQKISGGAFTRCGLSDIYIYNSSCEIDPLNSEGSRTIPGNVTIHGYEDSTAHDFANEFSNPFVSMGDEPFMLGDVDSDGQVSVMDATSIQLYLVGKGNFSEASPDEATPDEATADEGVAVGRFAKIADADRDGVVSVMDATQIQRYVAKKIEQL